MIFRSPFGEVSIPEVPLTEFVLERALERGDKPALIDGATGRVVTYRQLRSDVRRASAALAARGLKKGDVLALLSTNQPEFAVAFHAAALAGGVVTTVNPLSTAEDIAHQLEDAGANYLVAAQGCMEKAREASRGARLRELFVFGEAEGATPFDALLAHEGEPPRVSINPREDVVALPYSSGTTGLPKGVMLTHHNLVSNLLQTEATDHNNADDTLVGVLPFFHIYGMVVILNCSLRAGATLVTLPRFDLEQFLQTLETYGVTMAYVVPPIALALAKHPSVDSYDLSKLKIVFSGAAPLGGETTRALAERLGCFVKQGYGMTETSPVATVVPNDPAQAKDGSVGRPVPNTECKVVDLETGAELGAGEKGEICVRGPQVMKGYLNRPEATAQTIDADGWLHTGDIGYADADGDFFVVDRAKELIKYKGFQVAPAELEALLLTHPKVLDAAVVPSPDAEAGEVPKAFVVTRDSASAEELLEFVAARVAPYKKIRRLELIGQIPKSPSGKILRRLLVERERAVNRQS
ncbi:MAG TPA: AMP-binding protein [Pyrinomonadaceae bacterium]|nr:AMP-binding protein [Pyrinomonadaceae bacterium]